MGEKIRNLKHLRHLDVEKYGEENVDPALFTYPGPKPNSKETALVMLADTVEAKARADQPSTREEISDLVKGVFSMYVNNGQMDDTPLTFHDLAVARESFERVLQNIYHQRVRYPAQKTETPEKSESNETEDAEATADKKEDMK